jgi:hypothetical protein
MADVQKKRSGLGRFLRENGLSLVLAACFLFSLVGQSIAGRLEYNEDQRLHEEPTVGYVAYLGSPHFFEALTENWESEFLQIFAFVLFTAVLYQKGSSESKKLNETEPSSRDPRGSKSKSAKTPWPVRKGGLVLRIYESSLSLAFLLLFVLSFTLHGVAGARHYSAEQEAHGGHVMTVVSYMGSSRFWFESFQNWQSEFLSIALVVILSIFLRQRGSPQSKPVDAPHDQTGSD